MLICCGLKIIQMNCLIVRCLTFVKWRWHGLSLKVIQFEAVKRNRCSRRGNKESFSLSRRRNGFRDLVMMSILFFYSSLTTTTRWQNAETRAWFHFSNLIATAVLCLWWLIPGSLVKLIFWISGSSRLYLLSTPTFLDRLFQQWRPLEKGNETCLCVNEDVDDDEKDARLTVRNWDSKSLKEVALFLRCFDVGSWRNSQGENFLWFWNPLSFVVAAVYAICLHSFVSLSLSSMILDCLQDAPLCKSWIVIGFCRKWKRTRNWKRVEPVKWVLADVVWTFV